MNDILISGISDLITHNLLLRAFFKIERTLKTTGGSGSIKRSTCLIFPTPNSAPLKKSPQFILN